MKPENLQRYQLFKERYEDQAGEVRLARNVDEVGSAIRQIVSESETKKAILAPISPEIDSQVLRLLAAASIAALVLGDEGAPNGTALAKEISQADVGISSVSFGIAFTGTIVEITTEDLHRLVSSLPKIHIALLRASDIVANLDDAASRLRAMYQQHPTNCNITFISGPSRTADIEMKLFLGVHGPQESHVIVLDQE